MNSCGQLGIGNTNNQRTPQEIKFFKNMKTKQISCGIHHSLVLTGTKFEMI